MIRTHRPDDLAAMLEVNQANVPEVGSLDEAKLEALLAESSFVRVIELEGRVVGLLVVLCEGAGYGSPNYAWFGARHERFTYVDRVALLPEARGGGWGPALYHAVQTYTELTERPVICAEVNVEPPNPRSLHFHERFGFVSVAETEPYEPGYRVAMVEKALTV